MSYNPTTWVDGETPINASNLNKLEQGLKEVSEQAIDTDAAVNAVLAALPTWNGGGSY